MTTRARARRWLATGDAGIRETLATMQRQVRAAIADPSFIWWARQLALDCLPREEACQADSVRSFVEERVPFLRDPVGSENITPPLEHMRILRAHFTARAPGDCDDAATLSAALGMALGLPAQFVALAFPRVAGVAKYDQRTAPYAHVYTELLAGGRWREMDTTRPYQELPPQVVRRLTYPV